MRPQLALFALVPPTRDPAAQFPQRLTQFNALGGIFVVVPHQAPVHPLRAIIWIRMSGAMTPLCPFDDMHPLRGHAE